MEEAYEDKKVNYKEGTIWYLLLGISLVVILLSAYIDIKYFYYIKNAKYIDIKYEHHNPQIKDANGKVYIIDISGSPIGVKDGMIRLYYFDGKEKDAVVRLETGYMIGEILVILVMFGGIGTLSIYRLYRLKHPKQNSFSKYTYDKIEVSEDMLSKQLIESKARIKQLLLSNDEQKAERDKIAIKKFSENEKDFANIIINEQKKIFSTGELYIGEIVHMPQKGEYKAVVCITGEYNYFKNPFLIRDIINKEKSLSDIDKITKAVKTNTKDVYFAGVIYDMRFMPPVQKEHQLFYFLANPGMTDYVLMLPNWYYSKEDFEYL